MIESPFFSIIIPVYNGCSYGLEKCLDSIWSQPLDHSFYEVICVDDCSTDHTREWLHAQDQQHDNLIIVENEKNLRQGGARNRGFLKAKGKYIVLIDQDDYYHPGAIKQVFDHLQQSDLEVLIVDCAYQTPGKESNKLQHNFPHHEMMTGDEIIEKNTIPYAPWKFIFLKSLVMRENIFFEENERIEDVDWVHLLVHHAKRVQYQPILFIHYNKSDVSTTMTSFKSSVTTFSTLRLGKRLMVMTDTTFAQSSQKIRDYISHLANMFWGIGLRNYFFVYDSISNKRENIIQNIDKTRMNKKIIRLAYHHPVFFSIITNCSIPISRLAMTVYRKVKHGR